MFNAVKIGNEYDYNYREFVCDTIEDLHAIKTRRIATGSKATVLKDEGDKQQNYVLTGSREWIVDTATGKGGGSSAAFDMTDEEVLSTLAAANCLRVRTVNGKILTTGDKILLW